MDNTCAVVLAAGKGTRMNSSDVNKVTLKLGGKPIVQRIIEAIKNAGIKDIVVVVGFAKQSVIKLLSPDIIVAQQEEPQGTGHAVKVALPKIPPANKNILVVYGDDGLWFTPDILNNLYQKHIQSRADITFCTAIIDNPTGLGRVIREDGQVIDIVEEKIANNEQKAILEVNIGGFLIKKAFLEKNIDEIPKNPISKEYYFTDIIPVAAQKEANIQTLTLENFVWRGINTPEELAEAEKLLS